MNKRENLIKNIIDKYNQNRINSINKINIEIPAKENEEPFFMEFKKEINKYIFERENKKYLKNDYKLNIEENSRENIELILENNEIIDKKSADKITFLTGEILKKINIDFIFNKKIELKELIFEYIQKKITDFEITEEIKQKINELIYNLIENEINMNISNDNEQKNKELLKYFLNNILPEINEFYKRNSYEKLNQLSHFQKYFLINSFIEYLEKKFLRKQLDNNIITEKDYDFLKTKIKIFIIKQEVNLNEIKNTNKIKL